ncbi:MAG: hypothetical protein K5923_01790 [Clostridia bacterium]|nr:hypothetical protein [Clostridia bacterium]
MTENLFGIDYIKHYEIYEEEYKYKMCPIFGPGHRLRETYQEKLAKEDDLPSIERWNAFEINGVPIFVKYIECIAYQMLYVYFPTDAFKNVNEKEWDKLLQQVGLYKRVAPFDTSHLDRSEIQFINKDDILNGNNMEIRNQGQYSTLGIEVGFGYNDIQLAKLPKTRTYTYDIQLFDAKILNDFNDKMADALRSAKAFIDNKYANNDEYKSQGFNYDPAYLEFTMIVMHEILSEEEYAEYIQYLKSKYSK